MRLWGRLTYSTRGAHRYYLDGYVNEVVENGVSLKGLLREWTREGQYGWLFDNDKDSHGSQRE